MPMEAVTPSDTKTLLNVNFEILKKWECSYMKNGEKSTPELLTLYRKYPVTFGCYTDLRSVVATFCLVSSSKSGKAPVHFLRRWLDEMHELHAIQKRLNDGGEQPYISPHVQAVESLRQEIQENLDGVEKLLRAGMELASRNIAVLYLDNPKDSKGYSVEKISTKASERVCEYIRKEMKNPGHFAPYFTMKAVLLQRIDNLMPF
jgi:hypothetical protein